jgi:hypothetical protein
VRPAAAAAAAEAPIHAGPEAVFASDPRDAIFDVLRKAGVMNDTVTGRRRHPPLSLTVQNAINSALRSAGLLK